MYSSAASGDHLSDRVSDIPGDQVSNASNATISGADTRWVLICAHAHAGSCTNAQTCTSVKAAIDSAQTTANAALLS
jgi:hypothetical protein